MVKGESCRTCEHARDMIEGSMCCIPDDNHIFHRVLRCEAYMSEKDEIAITNEDNICSKYSKKRDSERRKRGKT